MADIIVTGGVLVPMDEARRIIANGAVAIEKDRIIDVGTAEEIAARHTAPTVIDARDKVILPGLIDAHAHAGHALIKTLGGVYYDGWEDVTETAYTVGVTPEFYRAEAQLAALECLRFGTTTRVSFLGGGDNFWRSDDPVYGDAHCDGVAEVGARTVMAVGPMQPPFPHKYARWENGNRIDYEVSYEQQLETCRALIKRWHGTHGDRISVALMARVLKPGHQIFMSRADRSDAGRQLREIYAMAKDNDLLFTQDGHCLGSVLIARDLGLLGPTSLYSHSIDLDDEEIQLCADTGTRIAHNPSSGRSVVGRCPVPELIEAGAVVAIGSDGTAPDSSSDMFRHMQQCMRYHRRHFRDNNWMPPGKVLEMCTIDAAVAIGKGDELGSLEVGKKADVILVDLRRAHLYPHSMPVFQLVEYANGNDIDTVIVDGRIALQNRKAMFVEENKILDNAQVEFQKLVERCNFQHRLEIPPSFWKQARVTSPNFWKQTGVTP